MRFNSSVTELKGVGSELAKKLAILNIHTISDLLYNYPRRYDDYSHIQKIKQIKPGVVTLQAVIKQAKGCYVRRGMHVTEAVASDDSGSVKLVWFNQPYRETSLKSGQEYYISGEFVYKSGRLSITNPSVELVSDFPVNTARIVPIYRETKGLKSLQIRKLIKQALPLLNDNTETLPYWLTEDYQLTNHIHAVRTMHFPDDSQQLDIARQRLGFEEVFGLTLAALLNKYELLHDRAIEIKFDETLAKQFVGNLPFKLTDEQRKAVWQIYQDMAKSQPMNRLIEGDVGSGKTVVATMSAIMAIRQGFQVAFMAPTELLARQHAKSLTDLLTPLGMSDHVALVVGGQTAKIRSQLEGKISSGDSKLIVGTHALIQGKLKYHKLGLVIVDEQHRFGVEQRKALQAKAGHALHVLNMTATPIPRSLALTLYGELDITVIATKPIGRKPIKTRIVSPNSRPQLYDKLKSEIASGRQVFVVCSLVADSEVLKVKSAEEVYKDLSKKEFKNYRVGLLHGKMKSAEKDSVMRQFADHKLDILVSTTVIEVGVDIPNATVMLVENAERFGLAQIHQLRGRVGRSEHQGYCYLMLSDSSAPSRRMRALESSSDGFALAEMDLEIRGPGAIYGTMQHGQLDLKVAKITDTRLIANARSAAQKFIDNKDDLTKYPELYTRVKSLRAVTNLN